MPPVDIVEDNLLREKVSEALFCRSIDREGARKVEAITSFAPTVLHMGGDPHRRQASSGRGATPLRQRRVHGREEGAHLPGRGSCFVEGTRSTSSPSILVGDGPLLASVRAQVHEMGVSDVVRLIGPCLDDQVLAGLSGGRWHTFVSSSIVAVGIQEEGRILVNRKGSPSR